MDACRQTLQALATNIHRTISTFHMENMLAEVSHE